MTLTDILLVMADRSQELALASKTDAERIRYLNLALKAIRLEHDFEETRSSSDLSFTVSSTLGYASVTAPTDWWAPIELNNSDNDYKFWYMYPDALKNIDRGGRYSWGDIEHAFAKDGANLLIYHNKTETLPLKYYSKNLINDISGTNATREDFIEADTTDTLVLENEDILISRALMYLMEKEPHSDRDYARLEAYYKELMRLEKLHRPTQRLKPMEELQFIS